MKKTLFFVAVAAIFTFASCQKEEDPAQNLGEDLVFTATIAGQDTKTTVDASTAKVAWESGDEITITDNASTSAKYKVSSVNKGRATFTKVAGQPTLGAGPYAAVYGSDPSTSQPYSATAPSLPMSASSATTSLEFTVSCGLLELSLTADESVTGIEVTGTPTEGSATTYTLNCSTPVSIASGAKFFIALPEGSYTSILIKGQNGAQCKKEKSGSSVAISANHITPVSFSKALHFTVQLWPDGPYWATTNIGADTPEAYGQYFAWGYTQGCVRNSGNYGWVLASDGATIKQFNTSFFSYRTTDSYQDAAAANWGKGWSVPTNTDLTNLLDQTNFTTIEYVKSGSAHWSTYGKQGILVTGKNEGYTSNSIFLPAAGFGSNSSLYDSGNYGYYWSSVEFSGSNVYQLSFRPESGYSGVSLLYGCCGYSVRPVRSSL